MATQVLHNNDLNITKVLIVRCSRDRCCVKHIIRVLHEVLAKETTKDSEKSDEAASYSQLVP
jgi:hypothetical protein